MRNRHASPRILTRATLCLAFAGVTIWNANVLAISLTGSNGNKVEFSGIKDSTPKGITAQMTAEGQLLGIPWEKLDIEALKTEHPVIFAAYERAMKGETVALNLGTYMEGGGGEKKPEAPKQKYAGWDETSAGGYEWMVQMPTGRPRGILLLAQGDDGRAFRLIQGYQRGSGQWGVLQTKYDLILMTYYFQQKTEDPTVADEFIYAEKKSGIALLTAIENLSQKVNVPEMKHLPIAVYGQGRTGAAFAYHLVQWKPERILAASITNGAFYDAKPTEASAKVPVLFIWGEYDNHHEIWKSENSAQKVLAEHASLHPNWTSGREPRGSGDMTLPVEYFGQRYLIEMLEVRLPEKVEEPESAPEPEPEAAPEGATTPPAEGAPAEGETPEMEEEKPGGPPELEDIDRSKGYVGNIETGEATRIKDPNAELGEDETFIPNGEVASIWKKFIEGTLDPPRPGSL